MLRLDTSICINNGRLKMVEKGPIHPDGPPQKLHKLHFATSPSSDLVLVISDEGLVVMGRLSRHCIKGYNKVVKRVRISLHINLYNFEHASTVLGVGYSKNIVRFTA